MKVFDGHPLDQIFSHTDPQGVTRHFNASAILRAMMQRKLDPVPEFVELEVTEELARFVEANHGVEQDHLERLSEADTNQPILLAHFDDGTDTIIDGSHRYVKRFRLGKDSISAIIVQEKAWTPYLVEDIDTTIFDLQEAMPFLDKVSARLKKG